MHPTSVEAQDRRSISLPLPSRDSAQTLEGVSVSNISRALASLNLASGDAGSGLGAPPSPELPIDVNRAFVQEPERGSSSTKAETTKSDNKDVTRRTPPWDDVENKDSHIARPALDHHVELGEHSRNAAQTIRSTVHQLPSTVGERRQLPQLPNPAHYLYASRLRTPTYSPLGLEDAFWAQWDSPKHVASSSAGSQSAQEPECYSAPELWHLSNAAFDLRRTYERGSYSNKELAVWTANHDRVREQAAIDRAEVSTSALLSSRRLQQLHVSQRLYRTHADEIHDNESHDSSRLERPANREPPSPCSDDAAGIHHERSLRREPAYHSNANTWSRTPLTDPSRRPICLIAAHEPGCVSRRPYRRYYTFSPIPFNPDGRSTIATPVIDDRTHDDYQHAETILGSPLFRGAPDLERLDEALDHIETLISQYDASPVPADEDRDHGVPGEVPESNSAVSDSPSSSTYDREDKLKSAFELWKERKQRTKYEQDPEISSKILGEVASILHERAALRTQGLADPFVRSDQEELDAEQGVRHRLENSNLAFRWSEGGTRLPNARPASRPAEFNVQPIFGSSPGPIIVQRTAVYSRVSGEVSCPNSTSRHRDTLYPSLVHPIPLYPPGFLRISFLIAECGVAFPSLEAEHARPTVSVHQMSPQTFHVINAPVQFRRTPVLQRASTGMAMRHFETGGYASGSDDELINELNAGMSAEEA